MTASLIAACLWVLACTVTAMLPMRLQIPLGLVLLLSALLLLIWIGAEHGVWAAVLAVLAVLSLFRRPLGYLTRRALGR
ncbi:MAG: DUF2484 family protein [Rhodobacteraceae bacterium]|nr:DUF2484 family protein [Paracoccaceae bacterium]